MDPLKIISTVIPSPLLPIQDTSDTCLHETDLIYCLRTDKCISAVTLLTVNKNLIITVEHSVIFQLADNNQKKNSPTELVRNENSMKKLCIPLFMNPSIVKLQHKSEL